MVTDWYAVHCTSIGLLEIEPAMPFSLVMLFELLLGELGPEPGALLHADSERKWTWLVWCRSRMNRCWSHGLAVHAGDSANHFLTFSTFTMNKMWTMLKTDPFTCHVQRALLCRGDRPILPPKQRATPALRNFLLQPGSQLQVGLRCWWEMEREM